MVSNEKMTFIREVIEDLTVVRNMKFVYNPKFGFYRYDNGIYLEDFEMGYIKHFIGSIYPTLDSSTLNEILEIMKREHFRLEEDFDKDANLIPLNNCLYNLSTDQIQPFTPDLIFTSRFAVNYNPEATCPVIDGYIKNSVEPQDQPVLEELLGFLLSRRYDYKYMFIFYGGMDSGKSTFLNVIKTFVNNNVSSVPPHTITLNQFAAAELRGKTANISGDISAKLIPDTSILKMLIGDDDIYANKKYGDTFSFKNHAKIIFACNSIPAVPEAELLLFIKKTIIIEFPYTVPKHLQDHTLTKRMTTPEELSGLLNRAILGRKRLRFNNDFSYKKSPDQIMDRFFNSSDPVVRFVKDMGVISVSEFTFRKKIWENYQAYAQLKKITANISENHFWKSIRLALPRNAVDFNRRVKGEYGFGGFGLRPLSEIAGEIATQEKNTGKSEVTNLLTSPEINPLEETLDMPTFPEPAIPLTKDQIDQYNTIRDKIREQENALYEFHTRRT